jgi:hypothetical protein
MDLASSLNYFITETKFLLFKNMLEICYNNIEALLKLLAGQSSN